MSSRSTASRLSATTAEVPMALYQQVKDHVLRKIADGSLSAGERVPSEQELVQEFGVARMTANRALRELAEQGVIVRVAGVGSFVAEEKPQSTLLRIANIAEEIRQRGHDHRFELISVRRESASPEVAASLQLSAGSSVFHLQGVHFENDVPVQLEDRHVNPRMAPDFMEQDFSLIQPSVYLVRNVPFDQIEHVVDAMLPTPEQARWLQMDADQPCLTLTRRTWYLGTPVTWVHCVHPGMRYRLGSRFRTDGGSHDG
ncbi:histidine utilization repressor [Delftia acidovorans]|uniref:histidine utilization repressor n=1 Tax=Delftia acidovorans TaxID=80866 RepID=UPI00241D6417|nr:histidine utilization repressor [Delftia acidovorans]